MSQSRSSWDARVGNVGDWWASVQRAVAFHTVVEMLNHPISCSWLVGVGVGVAWKE